MDEQTRGFLAQLFSVHGIFELANKRTFAHCQTTHTILVQECAGVFLSLYAADKRSRCGLLALIKEGK